MKIIKFILSILFLLLITNSFSQTGTIRGFVYDKETGEPIIFTNVVLHKTSYGAATDVNGYFVISLIPPGEYMLRITYLGYDSLQKPITVNAGDLLSEKLHLSKGSFMLDAVSITSEKEERKTETKISVVKLTPKTIQRIPTISGQADIAQYIQVLPGVVSTGDQGGQIYIRGGSAVQNKVLLDGMVVYNPFHSIGLFSVFETDLLRNADVYTGGFGAEYGGRISSIIDITTRDGNRKRFSGKIALTTFGSNFLLEGPILKQKDDNAGSVSFILSAKNSYLSESSKIFYNYVSEDGLPFDFTDLYSKFSINSSNGSKINFFGFNFNDKVDAYKSVADFNWKSFGGGMNFIILPGQTAALIEGKVSYSKYNITQNVLQEDLNVGIRNSLINGFNMGFDFTYFLGKNSIKYGIEVLGSKTDFSLQTVNKQDISEVDNNTELGAFVKYKMVKPKFVFEPGFRLQWYASLSKMSPEPRLAFKYNATEHFRIKIAGGLYSQNLISATFDRDVVNLFYGFISGTENLPKVFEGKDVKHKLQTATHAILGFEYDLTNHLTANIEGYLKDFSQLATINSGKAHAGDPDYIIETGKAYGADISLKYEKRNLYFWGVYSYGFVDRFDGVITYNPHYDRRHNINIVSSYTFGKAKDWVFGTRWNFGSGFPFTPTQGFYGKLTFLNENQNPDMNTDYTTAHEELNVILGELNSNRMPYYHRLDFNIKKTFFVSNNSKLIINLGATNIYDRGNIFYVDRVTSKRVNQLPFMPSLGINFKF